jgi:hypothetical protein
MGFPHGSQNDAYSRSQDCQRCLRRANARARQSQDTSACPFRPTAGEATRRAHSRAPHRAVAPTQQRGKCFGVRLDELLNRPLVVGRGNDTLQRLDDFKCQLQVSAFKCQRSSVSVQVSAPSPHYSVDGAARQDWGTQCVHSAPRCWRPAFSAREPPNCCRPCGCGQ